jgi:large subunit ribosomal protein L30
MAEKKLKITLVKSLIGAVPKNKATAIAMGLTKISRSVILPDNPSTQGQIRQIRHLIRVEEVEA